MNVELLPLSRTDLTKIAPASWIFVAAIYIGIRRGAGRKLRLTELGRHRTTWCDYLWLAWLSALVAVLVAEGEHIKPARSRLLHRSRLAQDTQGKDLNKYGWATLTANGKTGCPLEPICRTNACVCTAEHTLGTSTTCILPLTDTKASWTLTDARAPSDFFCSLVIRPMR